MNSFDPSPFFADWGCLPQEAYLRATYHVVPAGDPRTAAARLCAESSTAMWQRPGIAEDLRPQFAAKVIALEPLPGTPGASRVAIAHPHQNFGPRIPNLLAALAGEGVFYAPGITTIKLVDLRFPEAYLCQFEGPRFGVQGLRERMAVQERPFFIGVVKPNIGLPPVDFADQAYAAWVGGLDLCKDDEMQADAAWSPLGERLAAVGAARRRAEAAAGVRKWFIANITDEVARLPALVEMSEAAGANILMLNPLCTGISAVRAVRATAHVPIMGHFSGAAILSRIANFGIAASVLAKLMRLAGCDLVGVAGFGERMQTTEDGVLATIAACLDPMGPIKPALPIPGGSDWAGSLPRVYARIGHPDFGFIAGRGVFAHPMGPAAGARSLRQAWDAARAGHPLAEVTANHAELAAAVQYFGNPTT